ncbi:MAG: hypothetical protein ACI832_001381, partial [Rheinheimera aquimaris]
GEVRDELRIEAQKFCSATANLPNNLEFGATPD